MIAKRIESPKKTSSFKGLTKYITEFSKKEERQSQGEVGALIDYMAKPDSKIRISNCNFESIDSAIQEIEATQQKNTSSNNGRTYHLIVSFRSGEQPDEKILHAIEDEIVNKIGFEGHQRISALHTDTNNWHIHFAINKIHPVTFRNFEPYYDKFKMLEACRELEKEFGLLVDNGAERVRKKPMNPAQDKEIHSGIKSLKTWVREKTNKEITDLLKRSDPNWTQLHKILNNYGLTIRLRGAGMVIQDLHSGLTVKASSIDRNFSKAKLEKILGEFKANNNIYSVKEKYKQEPVQTCSPTGNKLWNKWQETQEKNKKRKKEEMKLISTEKWNYIKKVNLGISNRKKEAYKSSFLRWRSKKEVYAALQVKKLKSFEDANIIYKNKKADIQQKYPLCTWIAFLQKEAESGNKEALKLLRPNSKISTVSNEVDHIERIKPRERVFKDIKYRVDKRGRITYKIKDGWIMDDGKSILSSSSHSQVIAASLQIAAEKYGARLLVKGNDMFVAKVRYVAKANKMNLVINGENIISKQRKNLEIER